MDVESNALNRLFYCIVSVASEVSTRLRLSYKKWPWPLAKLTDQRISEDDRAEIAASFFSANVCCLDTGFGVKLRSAMSAHSDILKSGHMYAAIELLSMHKVHNIQIEDNFARSTQMRAASKGWTFSKGLGGASWAAAIRKKCPLFLRAAVNRKNV